MKQRFTDWNSIETSFNDSGHPVEIESKYHEINEFNNRKINENFSLIIFHLNYDSLSEHFEDLRNFYLRYLRKYSYNFISIYELKINKI